MKFEDIKEMSKQELLKKTKGVQSDLFMAKMKNSLGQLGNPLEIRKLRKDVARLKTAMTMNAGARGKK